MSIPTPPKALDGHCSTIDNGQLYVLSSNSFQSLALKQGAQWNQEATGKAVAGAACAKISGPDVSQSALYVVGGTSDDSSYTGLQRYFFGNKTWETLSPTSSDLRQRLNHSAIYIPDQNKILVYAGSPSDQPTWLSSQTFTVQAQPPYIIDSYVSKGHTANQPILDKWNNTHAIMTGGSDIDASVMLFSATDGWSRYQTDLSSPLVSGIKGELITGTDGSKVLQTYDLSISPNKVASVLLQGADGQPAAAGTMLGGSSIKRDLSASSWPAYNSTSAPTTARSEYSVASDGQGLVAFAGGNSNAPVALFNQTTNGWVDAASYFNSQQIPITTSTTSSPTASATASSSSAAASSGVPANVIADTTQKQHNMLALELGVIIGVCGGVFLIFLAVFLWLRHRKRRQNKEAGYGEGGRMSFADRGASFMKEAEGSTQGFFPTADRYNNSSRVPPVAPGALRTSRFSRRKTSNHYPKGSWESTKELVDKEVGVNVKELGYAVEPVEMVPVGEKKLPPQPIIRKPAPTYQSDRAEIANVLGLPLDEEAERRKRSSGWSRYFATNGPSIRGSHLPQAYREPEEGDTPVTTRDHAYPEPVRAPVPEHIPASTLMAPLNIDFTKTIDGQRLSKVASSNPSFANSKEDLAKRGSMAEPQIGKIEESGERPISTMTASSYSNTNRRSRTRSSIAASEYFASMHGINGTWTPMTPSFKDHVNSSDNAGSRRASSQYTNSMYGDSSHKRKSGSTGFFPGSGSRRSSKSKAHYSVADPEADWDHVKDELKLPLTQAAAPPARESEITVFPEPEGDDYTAIGRGPSQKNKNGSGLAGLTAAADNGVDRGSNMTLFPRAVSMKHYPGVARETEVKASAPANTDVSWVDIGAAR